MTYLLYAIVPIGLGIGFMIYMNMKNKATNEEIASTDFKSELNNASTYQQELLDKKLSVIKKELEGKTIDAFHYANIPYSKSDSIKDTAKDALKTAASLGFVKVQTVLTPMYLVLSGDELHFFNTDKNWDISDHYVFSHEELLASTIEPSPLEGNLKNVVNRTPNLTSFRVNLQTRKEPLVLDLLTELKFVNISLHDGPQNALLRNNAVKNVTIALNFFDKLGKKYPNLKADIDLLK